MNQTAVIAESYYSVQSKSKKACILVLLTLLVSLAGWIAETVLFYIQRKTYVDRGFLSLPFCPVYGLSMLGMYALFRTPQSGFWGKFIALPQTKTGRVFAVLLCIVCYAAIAALLASLIEYLTGLFYYKIFGVRLWNYRRYDGNIGGYICLPFSLLWGALAAAVMGGVWYPLQNALAHAKTAALAVPAVLLLIAVCADFVFNMVYLLRHDERLFVQALFFAFLRRHP